MSDKRKDYISWDEYFMGVAQLAGLRSKDPNTQVGACIVSPDNKILSMGYNGLPLGCSDDEFPWAREGETLETIADRYDHGDLSRDEYIETLQSINGIHGTRVHRGCWIAVLNYR